MISRELVEAIGISYPGKFKIDLVADPFPWFLLSVLFGARINESIAVKTFFLFRTEGLLDPEAVVARGWDGLVGVLDAGGYTRYDFKTATKLIEMSRNIMSAGSLNRIHHMAKDQRDLVATLKGLARGIGDVTVGIFLREMVGVWEKARPHPSEMVEDCARMLKVNLKTKYREIGVTYGLFESFLVTVGRRCFRSGCRDCLFPEECREYLVLHSNPSEMK